MLEKRPSHESQSPISGRVILRNKTDKVLLADSDLSQSPISGRVILSFLQECYLVQLMESQSPISGRVILRLRLQCGIHSLLSSQSPISGRVILRNKEVLSEWKRLGHKALLAGG